MATRKKPIIELRGPSRRDFIKYSVALGAFFGLDRWRIFETVGDVGGQALADEASCAITNRSVHIIAGTGGFAWFQLLWPHVDVAAAKNAAFAFHAPNNATMAQGTDRPLVLGPQAPWKSLDGTRAVTAFMAGENTFPPHLEAPTSTALIDNGKGLFAACAALQQANPTLVPVISVNSANAAMPYGAFAGAPAVAQVANADAMAGLFDSAASSAMGPLATPQNAAYFEAYYKGFLGLSAAAGRPTYAKSFRTGKIASKLVGVNLSNQLKPTAQDLARYGLTLSTPTKLAELARGLITTAKAFKLGLTSCVLLPAFNDDPHAAFADLTVLNATVATLGMMLDMFLKDLDVPDPTCGGAKIADNVVMSFHSDTPKTPLVAAAWPDDTPKSANWVYVLGAGWLRTGWYGGIIRDGSVNGFDPSTGATLLNVTSTKANAMPAAGAIAYAVAKGDTRRVGDYYRGVSIAGITRAKIM